MIQGSEWLEFAKVEKVDFLLTVPHDSILSYLQCAQHLQLKDAIIA